jgi:2-amino-4-hydroxy-6-hydroxymethyldihydropteridine diphosphokinase
MSASVKDQGTRAFIGLGGNLGDPRAAMRSALALIGRDAQTEIVAVSSLYRTPPWGKIDQPDFLNAVAELRTRRAPRELLKLCLSAEAELHRVRKERWGPRSIDLDLLVYGDREIDEEGLTVPHPRMLERAFVLVPLAEIAPDLVIGGRSMAQHLAGIDTTGIERRAGPKWWRRASAAG